MTGLPWVRLDTDFTHNPKTLTLVSAGRWRAIVVYIGGLGWAQAHGTAGFIPKVAMPMIHATKKDTDALVEVGLWHKSDIGDGWIVNDWAEYQPSSRNGNTSAKSAKGNCIRWHGIACGCWQNDPSWESPMGIHGTERNGTIRTVASLRGDASLTYAHEEQL